MDISVKERVVRLFLEMVSQFVALTQAKLATLGGQGFEAKVWNELGVPTDNGWLIERSRERSGQLMARYRYHTHNQLQTFHQILNGYSQDESYIDAFHLDLCGTFCNTSINNFEPVLPLILKSRGKSLAITVADQRRNLALEQWPLFLKRGRKLLGTNRVTHMLDELVCQQRHLPTREGLPEMFHSADPEKGAKREFAMLIELAELLKKLKLPSQPITMQRFIYISRYKRRPFRMRTYMFHFGGTEKKFDIDKFVDVWLHSTVKFGNDEGLNPIAMPASLPFEQPRIVTTQLMKGVSMVAQFSNLSAFMEKAKALAGDEVMAEFNQLVQESHDLSVMRQQLDLVRQMFNGGGFLIGGAVPQLPQTQPVTPASPLAAPGAKQHKPAKKKWTSLDEKEQILWLLKAMEIRDKLPNKIFGGDNTWENLLKQDFGYYDEELGRSLRSALAHANGGFRKHFMNKINKVFSTEAKPLLERLHKIH
jgi:hypothetical protein